MMHVASKWRQNSNSFNVVNENGQYDDATVASNQLSIACANYKHFCDILYLFQVSFSSIRVIGVFVFSLRHFARWSAQKPFVQRKKISHFCFWQRKLFCPLFSCHNYTMQISRLSSGWKKIEDNQIAYESFRNESFLYIVSNQLLCS